MSGLLFERWLDEDRLFLVLWLAALLVVLLLVVVMVFHIVFILTRIMIPMKVVLMMLGDALEMRFELAMTLLPGKRADLHVDVSTCHLGLLITLAHRFEVFLNLAGKLVAELLMRHLAAAELELDAHLVTFGEEVLGMGDLDEVVMRVDADAELHLLYLAALLMLVGLLLVLFLDVFEFAVVDDLAHGRIGHRRHFDEIETALTGDAQRLMRGQDAELVMPVLLDDANLRSTDALVDAVKLVGMTPAVAITSTRASGPVSTASAATAEGPGRSTTLSWRTVLRRPGRGSTKAIASTSTRALGPRSNGSRGTGLGRTLLRLLRTGRKASELSAVQALEWIANRLPPCWFACFPNGNHPEEKKVSSGGVLSTSYISTSPLSA